MKAVIDAKEIKNLGNQLGIDEIRITTAEPFSRTSKNILDQKNKGLFINNRHHHINNINTFCDVKTKLPNAKSIIAACQCYLTDEKTDLSEPGKPHGLIARYTWRNYYLDLKKKLKKLGQFIKRENNATYRVFSNGPVPEKPIAQRSGIGYYGKHSIIINQTYGSWIVLGEIIADIEIEPDASSEINCGNCQKCIDACPTAAIAYHYVLNCNRCIQALTNWYGIIPDDIARAWGNRLYGCTICQDVCPANKNVKPHSPRTDLGYVGSSISLLDILQMDETEYRQRFPNNQITATWINFKAIKRNALIALGNIKDKKTLQILKKFARIQDEVLSKTAQWAIANF
ncbi:tRNA epoxyqueuosine(34) reductase QueG [candidate division WOR-3 bacterium]|nr:tRNA epoxyqueuosine(34) reductase QueG [candidate division WOR-3 bacterium]